MPRPYRFEAENCFYHITSRGNNKNPIYAGEKDYTKFLQYLLKTKEKYKFYIYAYVLMTNHYHLFLQTTLANLSKIMQYLNTAYTVYYNRIHNRCGHLFQGRYNSLLVDTDNYFLKLTRYIHLNPVKAKIVEMPEDYKWSSYRGYFKKDGDRIIDKQKVDLLLGMSLKEYKNFVLAEIDNEQQKLFEDTYAGCILGKEDFIKNTLKKFRLDIVGKEFAYQKDINNGIIDIYEIIEAVKQYYKTKETDLTLKRKNFLPRKIAIYLSERMTQKTNREIGEIFNIGHSAVGKIAHNIEKLMTENKNIGTDIPDIQRLISNFGV